MSDNIIVFKGIPYPGDKTEIFKHEGVVYERITYRKIEYSEKLRGVITNISYVTYVAVARKCYQDNKLSSDETRSKPKDTQVQKSEKKGGAIQTESPLGGNK